MLDTKELTMSETTAEGDLGDHGDSNLEYVEDLNGLFVAYEDDRINETVNSYLKTKSRVRYKTVDTCNHFIAFGTSSGAIYLFEFDTPAHTECSLLCMVPCDQGSVEAVKFLPDTSNDDLLILVGTARGSLVVFRFVYADEQHSVCTEIYKVQSFTQYAIKIIEYDSDLLNPARPIENVYITDAGNRVYELDKRVIYQSTGLFGKQTCATPKLICSFNESKINQICVQRGQFLISTDETTRLSDDKTKQLEIVGSKKKRRKGFYGACFFNPDYKPVRVLQVAEQQDDVQSIEASTYSLAELKNLSIYVARPMFRLWQVNTQREVMLTHQFEPLIKSFRYNFIIELSNQPIKDGQEDDPRSIMDNFASDAHIKDIQEKSNSIGEQFNRMMPMYSSTLGNLLLCYNDYDMYIIDPIGTRLIAKYRHTAKILCTCCNDNEIFVWSYSDESDQAQSQTRQILQVKRLLLLAPTQFVLELHRLHRYETLISFVERFSTFFCRRMALPLDGLSTITTEGGLLRNILLNAYDMCDHVKGSQHEGGGDDESRYSVFRRIINCILDESRQLRYSLDNLRDSRFFIAMTSENIDRLCSEPYASLVSLEVSINELHTNHVIHFSKEALNRHKSSVNLSQVIKNQNRLLMKNRQSDAADRAKSSFDLSSGWAKSASQIGSLQQLHNTAEVMVERQRPKRNTSKRTDNPIDATEAGQSAKDEEAMLYLGVRDREADCGADNTTPAKFSVPSIKLLSEIEEEQPRFVEKVDEEAEERDRRHVRRCEQCKWPRALGHLRPLLPSQVRHLKYIEENLINNFEENIDEIERSAFENGLWRMYMKCLVYKNQIDDYVTCCMSLDDLKLLDLDQFVVTRRSDTSELIDRLLDQLSHKTALMADYKLDGCDNEVDANPKCLKCLSNLESIERSHYIVQRAGLGQVNMGLDSLENLSPGEYERRRFNLTNLLDLLVIRRRNTDIKRMIERLLKHEYLLNSHKIPSSFYLKAIRVATSTARQSNLDRSRQNHDRLNDLLLSN